MRLRVTIQLFTIKNQSLANLTISKFSYHSPITLLAACVDMIVKKRKMAANPYYWDVNIWLDIYEKRGFANEVATKLFKKIIIEDGTIFYSDLVVDELKKVGYSEFEINQIFGIAKPDHLKRVHIYKKHIDEAREVARKQDVPEADALHAILARDNQFTLVSRDQKDFPKLRYIWPAKLPEELI